MASAAATRDPRFPPIDVTDLPAMTVEISVLSPDVIIHRREEIVVGRHGLDVRRGGARGLLLPQVAVEHGLDRDAFLAATCRKAGLPADAWHDDATEIRVFEAEVFGDEAAEPPNLIG
jgi:AmmeMemoRadiSam system protein A